MLKNKTIIILIIGLIILVFVEYSAPKPIAWKATYKKTDKIPFGTYLLWDLLPEIFPEQEITENRTSWYLLFKKPKEETTFFYVNSSFQPDHLDKDALLDFVNQGNTAFIAAYYYGQDFLDTLSLNIDFRWQKKDTKGKVNFFNYTLQTDSGYVLSNKSLTYYFSEIDTLNTFVLGYYEADKNLNFLKIPFGDGFFYLNTQPEFFSNYNIIKRENTEYLFKALSYFPDNKSIIWDEYYKIEKGGSPLRYILSSSSFKLAYYLFLFLLFVYIIFEIKRRQREIPIFAPPKNTSKMFAQTIGQLYFHKRDNKDLVEKQIIYLFEFLRNKYFLTLLQEEKIEVEKIIEKTGASKKTSDNLFNKIRILTQREQVSDEDLLKFNLYLEKFKRECK